MLRRAKSPVSSSTLLPCLGDCCGRETGKNARGSESLICRSQTNRWATSTFGATASSSGVGLPNGLRRRFAPRNDESMPFDIHIIGGGLAGSEVAWQLAEAGPRVRLSEMGGGGDTTPAHGADRLSAKGLSKHFPFRPCRAHC